MKRRMGLGMILLPGLVSGLWAAAPAMPAASLAPAAAWARPDLRALRLPDLAVTIDGEDADWRAFGGAFDAAGHKAAFPANLHFGNTDRGSWLGPDDFALEAWVATDSLNVYVLANVHDQLLFNDADPKEVYIGDDFELFIDANPPAAQFAATRNENTRQFIFLPAWCNPAQPAGLVWQADENPGVKFASRLHPWGYTIEVLIPKALFPNWRQNPALDSVGFDVMAGDADSPGMDGPHGALKYAGFLLSPGNHFMTSEKLGRLTVDKDVAAASGATAVPVRDPIIRTSADLQYRQQLLRERAVQTLLADINTAGVGGRLAAAIASEDAHLQKTALFILARRPELPAPTPALLTQFAPTPNAAYPPAERANYALTALAVRHQLPAADWFAFYAAAPDPQLRLTWVWCLGKNGDPAVAASLQTLLTDTNLRIRVKAAGALGELGNPSALPALEKMKTDDPHNYARRAAEEAIQKLRKP